MQKIGVFISLCVLLQTAATRSLDLEAERESDIDKRHLKLLGDLMKTPEAQDIVKNSMILFGNLLSPGKRDVSVLDEDEDLDSLVRPEELQQTLATRTLDPNFLKGLGELMKTPEAQEIAKSALSLLGKVLAPEKRDVLEWDENMDSPVEELASMLED